MSSIPAYSYGTRVVLNATASFKDQKETLDTLQKQLSTGRTADTFAGLGSGASTSLRLNARISTLEGYGAAITDAQVRISLASAGLEGMSKLAHDIGSTLTGYAPSTLIDRTAGQLMANGALSQAVDALNVDVNGRYLFSGRAADTEPLASLDLILNGDIAAGGTRAGLKKLISERQVADLGTAGLGRLTTAISGATGTTVTLAEEAAGLPFGYKIAPGSTPSSATGTVITTALAAGSPRSITIDVPTQPNPGDSISVDLTLPDGSTQTLTLTASSGATTASANTFVIGATAGDTATNLKNALNATLATAASMTLWGASAVKASSDFFAGSNTNPPLRVVPPVSPATDPTAYVAGTDSNTVIWYLGDDANVPVRATAPVQIGDNQSVAIGLRANEPGLQALLAGFGALAASDFPDSVLGGKRYDALSGKLSGILLGPGGAAKVEAMNVDLGNASATLQTGLERVNATKVQVQNMVAEVDNRSPQEVAAELISVQTRLQASYQTVATIAKMSLVDYL
jgi:flagellar hook-associated protein 3 FlgL